jgi:hypothetical protein
MRVKNSRLYFYVTENFFGIDKYQYYATTKRQENIDKMWLLVETFNKGEIHPMIFIR